MGVCSNFYLLFGEEVILFGEMMRCLFKCIDLILEQIRDYHSSLDCLGVV